MRQNYEHVTESERRRIERLRDSGKSLRTIAQRLGRSVSTISDELKRNKVRGVYDARKAQHKAYVRRWRSKQDCLKVVMNAPLKKYVEDKLRDEWSPELISGRLEKQRYIYPRSRTPELMFVMIAPHDRAVFFDACFCVSLNQTSSGVLNFRHFMGRVRSFCSMSVR